MTPQCLPAAAMVVFVLSVGLIIFGAMWSSWSEAHAWKKVDRAYRIQDGRA